MIGLRTRRTAAGFRPMTVRQLMWRKFVRHRLAVAAGIMLIVMYVVDRWHSGRQVRGDLPTVAGVVEKGTQRSS